MLNENIPYFKCLIRRSHYTHNIKVDKYLLSVESVADKWITEDTDSYYYDINKI